MGKYFNELNKDIKKFSKERDWTQFHNPKDLAIAVSIESAELLEPFRFKSDKEVQEIIKHKKEEVADEIADIHHLLIRFCQITSIDLHKATKNKLKKLEKKYPKEKSKGKNKKYNE